MGEFFILEIREGGLTLKQILTENAVKVTAGLWTQYTGESTTAAKS